MLFSLPLSLPFLRLPRRLVVIPWAGAFVVLMESIVVKGFQQTLPRLTLNRVFSLKILESGGLYIMGQ